MIGPPPLARAGLDRAAERRTDPEWLAAAWQRARVLLIDPAGRALCEWPEAGPRLASEPGGPPGVVGEAALDRPLTAGAVPATSGPTLVYVAPAEAPVGERLFLGVDQADQPYFAVVAELPTRPGARPVTVREVGAALPALETSLLTTAVALVNWHASHRYSPVTGELTVVRDAGWLRVDGRGGQVFPRTDPAVIVLVHDGVAGPAGRCLLGHNAAWRGREPRFFSALAGFVEPGEAAEAAAVREVREEVGVAVSQLRYQGSQAWPFPASLMLGFTGYADPAQPVRPDGDEIVAARWFTRAELAPLLLDRPDSASGPAGALPDARAGEPVASDVAPGDVALPGPTSMAHHLLRVWFAGAEDRPAG